MTCAVHTARLARRATGDGQCGTAKWQRRMRGLLYSTLSTSPHDQTDNYSRVEGKCPSTRRRARTGGFPHPSTTRTTNGDDAGVVCARGRTQ